MKKIIISLFIIFCNTLFSQLKSSEDFFTKKNINQDLYSEFFTKKVLVEVISTCPNNRNLCGIIAFGSVSFVKVLNGKYENSFLYVAKLCSETKYKLSNKYLLEINNFPSYSVVLCNGLVYNIDWNSNLEKYKYYIIFGNLK